MAIQRSPRSRPAPGPLHATRSGPAAREQDARRCVGLAVHRARPADRRPRRDHREHRPAVRPARPGAQRREPAVGRHRVHPGLRQAPAARRPDRRPRRPKHTFMIGLIGFAIASALGGARGARPFSSAPARSRVSSPRSWRRPALSLLDHDLHRRQGALESVRHLRRDRRCAAPRSNCCSAVCSPRIWTGAGTST